MENPEGGGERGHLAESKFRELWNVCFNLLAKIRAVKRVSGKCWTCAYIHEVRDQKQGPLVNEACKELMTLHRSGFFMVERLDYRIRVREAVDRDPNNTMSFIIDGASQNHCHIIPHSGAVGPEFGDGLPQHLQGVLTHGHGK